MKETSLFKIIVDNVSDGVLFADHERRISLWSKSAEDLTGYPAAEMTGNLCPDLAICHAARQDPGVCAAACPLQAALQTGAESAFALLLAHKDGAPVEVTLRTFPVFSGGEAAGVAALFSAAQLPCAPAPAPPVPEYDPLTGLPGQPHLEQLLRQRMEQGGSYGVFFADLDYFSAFNTYYGEEVGDVALQSIASSFAGNLPGEVAVGRWADDIFFGICELPQPASAFETAEKIRALIAGSAVQYGDELLSVTASVGLAQAQAGDSFESLIDRADDYTQQSKQRGKNCCTIDTLPPEPLPEDAPPQPATEPEPPEYNAPAPLPKPPEVPQDADPNVFLGQRLL